MSETKNTKDKYVYPKGERVWVKYCNEKQELMFIVTTKESTKDFYYLYEFKDGKFKKLGKSRSPRELEEKFEINEKIRKPIS